MRIFPIVVLLLAGAASAQDAPPPPALQPVPDGAPEVPETEEFEPEVTIIRRQDTTIEEYRANGRLYMVRVTPKVGLPYYLVDSDGDGNLETRYDDNFDRVKAIPGWVIFSW